MVSRFGVRYWVFGSCGSGLVIKMLLTGVWLSWICLLKFDNGTTAGHYCLYSDLICVLKKWYRAEKAFENLSKFTQKPEAYLSTLARVRPETLNPKS